MGLFEKIFKPKDEQAAAVTQFFRTMTAYSPSFSTRAGGVYEMEVTKAAIHAYAKHCSKLKPEVIGPAKTVLEPLLQFSPNPFMDTTKFLYRLATILKVQTTAFIVPLTDPTGTTLVGFYPLLPGRAEVVEVGGEPWLRYTFSNGRKAAIEFSRVGILTTHQYDDDFFGSGNDALSPTLDLLDIQRQGMQEGVKQSAFIRFLGRLGQTLRPEDIKKERDEFSKDNLSSDNKSGLMLVDAKYAEIKQIEAKPFLVDAEQMKLIKDSVYSYFGVNDAVLQSSYDENGWNAFYESEIETFALQLGLVLSNMIYTQEQRAAGGKVIFSANRLQYASNTTKLEVSSQMFDRGNMTQNQIMEMWNLPGIGPEGDKRYIRREYVEVDKLDEAKQPEGVTVQVNGTDTPPVEDLQATALNGAQIAALVAVIQALKEETLTLGQAANIVAVALAIDVNEAKKIVEGTV